jgi:MFS transporter, MHS family, proline/betaine transporter
MRDGLVKPLAGIAGNVMEWYDFTVYGYFAAIIGSHFFPTQDKISSLLAAFSVFAAGFRTPATTI